MKYGLHKSSNCDDLRCINFKVICRLQSFSNWMFFSCRISTDKRVARSLCHNRASCSTRADLDLQRFCHGTPIVVKCYQQSLSMSELCWLHLRTSVLYCVHYVQTIDSHRCFLTMVHMAACCQLANALSYIPHFPLFKKWFHVQFIACNALHFCTIIAGIPTVGKPAIITQKLQWVACNELHMKPLLK